MGVTIGLVVFGLLLVGALVSPRRLLAWWALAFAVASAVACLYAASVGAWGWAGIALVPLIIATYEFVHEVRMQRIVA